MPAESSLRIAMFTPWKAQCGISDYSRHLVEALKALPDMEDVVIVEPPSDAAKLSTWQAVWRRGARRRLYQSLGQQMSRQGIHIAHIQHQYFFFGGVSPLKNRFLDFLQAVRPPVVMTVHELALPQDSSLLRRLALTKVNRDSFLAPNLQRLVVHTEADRVALQNIGCDPDKVIRMPHPVPPAAPMPDAAQAKRVLNLQGKQVLTIFGFISKKKGHFVALEALRQLPPNVVLLLAGGRHPDDRTDYVDQIYRRAEAWNLRDRLVVTDYLPETSIPTVMAATDIALAPYLQTSGSGSLANLLAYGRAIVASNIPPHIEIAASTDPACLHLVAVGNPTALARAVEGLLGDPHGLRMLQEAALRYAKAHPYLQMARNLVTLYRDLLRR
ncbi:glycosyltransferase [Chthonomonas calidirosea]|uniref:glycosyltransferase n=1 Tax=Chthonomonas calidirosea TaxID=454171 RepID=UPI0006EC58A8|nr:glycosyltransferase [Chthonomonas calidirosea]CEK17941.1 glycosyltransferase [Chthonomonas calidirosea]